MDIFQAIYYFCLFCGPILLYFIFKKRPEKSRYSKPVWYHSFKKWLAKKEIDAFKEKFLHLETNILQEHEQPKKLEGTTETDTKVIYGADTEGNLIVLKTTLRENKHAEVSILLKLKDGRRYTLPNKTKSLTCSTNGNKWKADSLEISILEPLRRLRITYNGLLLCENVSDNTSSVEHVNFNLIWNNVSPPMFHPTDTSDNLLADALAREQWKDNYWIELVDVEKGYMQAGEFIGLIRGSNIKDDYIVQLPSFRQRYYGPLEAKCLYRNFFVFGVCESGLVFAVGVKSYRRSCSHLKYGFIIKSNKDMHKIEDSDIALENLFDASSPPNAFTIHFKANDVWYRCVCHVDVSSKFETSNEEENGWVQNVYQGEMDVNQRQGVCLVTSWRKQRGPGVDLPPPLLSSVVYNTNHEKILVSAMSSEHSQILEVSGGKGNSLSLLANIKSEKFAVPDGFIITVDAFKQQLKSKTVLRDALKELEGNCLNKSIEAVSDNCEKVSTLFASEEIDEEVKQEILKYLQQFAQTDSGVKWAVRSSGIGEDSEDLSAAGQNSTFLGCSTNEQVLKAVSQCWGSLYSFQSLQYRIQHGSPVYTEMAVVVQKMVPSDIAGVLFTCHPTTGNPAEMVVTANYGLGESVVSGQADPDTIVIARTVEGAVSVKSQTIGGKRTIITMSTNTNDKVDDGTKVVEVSNDESARLCLREDQVILLGEVGVLLERKFGGPRDIEWAYYQDKLYLLQSRPITTLNTWTDFELRHEFDTPAMSIENIMTRANVGEVMPGALTAITQSLSCQAITESMQQCSLGNPLPYTPKMIYKNSHRVFLDLINSLYSKVRKSITLSDKVLDIAILGHIFKDEKIHKLAIEHNGLIGPLGLLKEMANVFKLAYKNKSYYEKSVRLSKNHTITIEDSDTIDEIIEKIEAFVPILRISGTLHGTTSEISVFYQFFAMQILAGNAPDLTSDHFHDISYLLSSCTGVVSAEVPVILDEIAQEILAQGYSEEFLSLEPKKCLPFIKSKVPKAYEVYQRFLEFYGHRSIREFEVAAKSWNMDDELIMTMIQANAKSKTFTKKAQSLTPEETISKLISVQSKATKSVLKWLVKKCRAAVKYREATKSELIRTVHKIRLALLAVAEKMIAQGYLTDTQQIFHFTFYELKQYIAHRNPSLMYKVMRRMKLYKEWDALKYGEMHYGIPVAENEKNDELGYERIGESSIKLSGTPVYTGNVMARCCVVPDLSQIDQLKSGDILITYSTDIAWSPYFPILAGIVTELGGLISHGAVVAREYGLPAIVGVKDASKYFKTGDMVLLNGKNGTIELIERTEDQ